MATSDLDVYLQETLRWVHDRLTPILPIPMYTSDTYPWWQVQPVEDGSAPYQPVDTGVPLALATFDSLEQPFQHYGGRLLLLGAPGSGKTTLLLTFLSEALHKRLGDVEAPVPVFVDIKHWRGEGEFTEWIASRLAGAYPRLDFEDLPLLYLLDGLDELGGPRTAVSAPPGTNPSDPRANFIHQVALDLPYEQVIVSCRTQDYEQIGRKVAMNGAVQLLPITSEQIRGYLFARNLEPLWEALKEDSETLKVLQTPLTLSILGSIANSTAFDPEVQRITQADVFKLYLAHRFAHEGAKRSETGLLPPLAFDLQSTEEKLGALAAYMWRSGIYPASFVGLDEAIKALGANAEAFLAFVSSMGLLQWEGIRSPSSSGIDTVSFFHLKFRDYFAVSTILGYLEDPSERPAPWRKEYGTAKRSWIYALAGIGDSRALPYLIDALRSPGVSYQTEAAFALGRIGDKAAIPALVESLQHGEWEVRAMAAYALGKVGDATALSALSAAVRDPDSTVLEEAAYALGQIGDVRAVPALLEALVATTPRVREVAADMLAKIGLPAVAGLEETLKHENPVVRELAAQVLTRITGLDTYSNVADLHSVDPDVRRTSLETLGETGGTGTAADIAVALTDDDPGVREAACYALAKVGARGAPSALLKALKDTDPAVREAAAYALGQIRDARAIPALQDMLKDDDWSVRATAAHVLGTTGYKRVVSGLLEALTDENTTVRAIAANALGEVGDRGAVTGLRQALNDPDEDVREIAKEALEQINNRRG